MRLLIVHDIGYLRRWHVWLACELAKKHQIELAGVAASRPIPGALKALQCLERAVYVRGAESACDWCDPEEFSTRVTVEELDLLDLREFGLALDLSSGGFRAPEGLRVITPLYNGFADELAAVAALMEGDLVNLGIHDTALGGSIYFGRSAAADPNVLTRSLSNVFCRAAALLLRMVEGLPPRTLETPPPRRDGLVLRTKREMSFFVTSVARKAISLLNEVCGRGMQWGIAWRHTVDNPLRENATGEHCAYSRYPNNRGSYFADPFVLARDGRHYLFVEEFLFAARKGVISVISVEEDGTVLPSRVVLERPYHLSYPFVFERDGEIFMIPESSAAGQVELYRAHRFPEQWSLEAVLINGIVAHDSTLCQQEGRLWMLMTTSQWQSATWDNLEIFHAMELQGPWIPSRSNPVMLDPVGTRPGGCMYESKLWRPAQCGETHYGASLTLCRVDQLTPDDFRQTPITLLEPADKSTTRGVHTLNYADGLEVIDIYGIQSAEPVRLAARAIHNLPDRPGAVKHLSSVAARDGKSKR